MTADGLPSRVKVSPLLEAPRSEIKGPTRRLSTAPSSSSAPSKLMLALAPLALAFTLPSFTPTTSHTAAVSRHASVACSLSRRDAALFGSGAALFGVMGGIPAPAYAAEIKKVVVAGATGQTGRRALSLLAKTSGVSVVGGVRDTAKAAKKLSESKIEIRGAMI